MDSRIRAKNAIYEQFSRVGKTLAAPKRLELLDLLTQCPRTVEALAEQANLSVANASQHLRVLRAARLVESEKSGLFVEYRLASPAVAGLFSALRSVAEERIAELDAVAAEYLGLPEAMESVTTDELLRRVTNGEVTVLDVRPREEFLAGHLSGALSIPLDELRARLDQLPKDLDVVAYCRGPYCVMAVEAVEELRTAGFVAHRLESGILDFRSLGVPVGEGDR